MYLCERMLGEADLKSIVDRRRKKAVDVSSSVSSSKKKGKSGKSSSLKADNVEVKRRFDSDSRSAAALQGAYHNLNKEARKGGGEGGHHAVAVQAKKSNPIEEILAQAIQERQQASNARSLFNQMDETGSGKISAEQFVAMYYLVDSTLGREQVLKIFEEADHDDAGFLDYEKFEKIAEMPALQKLRALQTINRPRSLLQVEASDELYFGEALRDEAEQSVGLLSIEQSREFLLATSLALFTDLPLTCRPFMLISTRALLDGAV